MKLIDFLKIVGKDTSIVIEISKYGIRFKAVVVAGYLADDGNLKYKTIDRVYVTDNHLHIRLED